MTVTPTDELGRTYDIQTYTFPGAEPDATPPAPPTTVTATALSTSTINVSWSGATDNVGVTGYHLFRDGLQIADQAGTSFTDATASPDTSYSYTVVAVDAAGNVSAASAAATVSTTGAPDGTPPSQPGNLTATAASSSQVNLTWSASTDNIGVTGYHVYRNGTQLQTPTPPDATPPTAYTDDTAQPGTAYTYQVSAVDAAGNESTRAGATVSTPSAGGTLTFSPTDDATVDSSQPTVNFGTNSRLTVDNSPINYSLLKFTVAGTGGCPITAAKLQLTVGNGTDDKSPYGGDVYGTTSNTWTQSTVTWNTAPAAGPTKVGSVPTAVALSTSYQFDVTPLVTGDGTVSMVLKSTNSDGARYYSKEGGTPGQVPQLQVTCGTAPADATAPTQPTNFAATAPSSSQVNLTWTPSTDNVGVTGYRIYRDAVGTPLATVDAATNSYSDSTVTPSTAYTYQVSAVDAAGNESTRAGATVSTPSAGGTLTFSPTDDATVDSSQPTVNFGTNSRLTVDNSPINYSLLKFTVAGTGGCPITAAKLQLTVGNGTDDKSPYGGDVYGTTTNTWTQSTVTWNTAPVAGATKVGSVPTAVSPEHQLPVRRHTTGHRGRHGQHGDQEHQQRRGPVLLQRRRHPQSGPPTPSHLRMMTRRGGARQGSAGGSVQDVGDRRISRGRCSDHRCGPSSRHRDRPRGRPTAKDPPARGRDRASRSTGRSPPPAAGSGTPSGGDGPRPGNPADWAAARSDSDCASDTARRSISAAALETNCLTCGSSNASASGRVPNGPGPGMVHRADQCGRRQLGRLVR